MLNVNSWELVEVEPAIDISGELYQMLRDGNVWEFLNELRELFNSVD